jgi:hypothetical protein
LLCMPLRWPQVAWYMQVDTGCQAVLRFCLWNLRGCSVGITDQKDLYPMIITTVTFITLVNWYNNRLLPLIRQFFLNPNRIH